MTQLAIFLVTTARRSVFLRGVSESANQPPIEVAELQARLAAALAERDEALSQVDRLQHLLRQLQRMQFGRRSEKLDPDQFELDPGFRTIG